ARDSFALGANFPETILHNGRLTTEFDEGDLEVLNPHSLDLLRNEKGRGKKLLMKYDVSSVSCWPLYPSDLFYLAETGVLSTDSTRCDASEVRPSVRNTIRTPRTVYTIVFGHEYAYDDSGDFQKFRDLQKEIR
ncbi:hypothetical protein B0H10DRAFT_1835613, partial [Mycena sp. CBHHK59/15]